MELQIHVQCDCEWGEKNQQQQIAQWSRTKLGSVMNLDYISCHGKNNEQKQRRIKQVFY